MSIEQRIAEARLHHKTRSDRQHEAIERKKQNIRRWENSDGHFAAKLARLDRDLENSIRVAL